MTAVQAAQITPGETVLYQGQRHTVVSIRVTGMVSWSFRLVGVRELVPHDRCEVARPAAPHRPADTERSDV